MFGCATRVGFSVGCVSIFLGDVCSFHFVVVLWMSFFSICLLSGSLFGQWRIWWSLALQRPHWFGRLLNSNVYSIVPSLSKRGMTMVCGSVLKSHTRSLICGPQSFSLYASKFSTKMTCPICYPIMHKTLSFHSTWHMSTI